MDSISEVPTFQTSWHGEVFHEVFQTKTQEVTPYCWSFQESKNKIASNHQLSGGFKYFLFSPLPGEMIQFDYSNIFQLGWNHQPAKRFRQVKTHPIKKPNIIRFRKSSILGNLKLLVIQSCETTLLNEVPWAKWSQIEVFFLNQRSPAMPPPPGIKALLRGWLLTIIFA